MEPAFAVAPSVDAPTLAVSEEVIACHCDKGTNTVVCLINASSCCWCADARKSRRIYIDEYGLIEPATYHLHMPRDLYYCANCRHPDTISVGIFTERLKNMLPPSNVFHCQITKEKKAAKIEAAEKRHQRHLRTVYEQQRRLKSEISKMVASRK